MNQTPAKRFRGRLIKMVNHLYKRELDPRRAARVYRHFDLQRGYQAYHDRCRAALGRANEASGAEALESRGVDYLPVLGAAEAAQILDRLQREHALEYVKKDTRNLQGFRVDDPAFIETSLAAVLTEEVDRRLIGFFQSEYLVHWVTYSMTPRAPEQPSVSFRWHCDRGPRSHLKLIVYLNPSDEHGGNTEFIELDDTSRIAKRGYVFGWTATRTGDIDHLARIAGTRIRPLVRPMGAGEGVIFQPASVLHRGLSPHLGPRYVVTLCLLPSPIHWRDALHRGALSDLSRDAKWHRHVSQLESVLTAASR